MDLNIFLFGIELGLTFIILVFNLMLAISGFERKANLSIFLAAVGLILVYYGSLCVYISQDLVTLIRGAKILHVGLFLSTSSFAYYSYYLSKKRNKTIVLFIVTFSIFMMIYSVVNTYGLTYSSIDLTQNWTGI